MEGIVNAHMGATQLNGMQRHTLLFSAAWHAEQVKFKGPVFMSYSGLGYLANVPAKDRLKHTADRYARTFTKLAHALSLQGGALACYAAGVGIFMLI
jgi:hypothetical protein